jgi:ATP-dependent helicase HrpB
MPSEALPIDGQLGAVRAALAAARAAVLVAPPGSGKTTRVPPALVPDGPVFLLQPRRVAARSIARRIADEQGWRLGGEVGWQVRFEHRYGPDTRLLVATEGILTRRLQSDPLLSGFRTIVLDEFHERSLHADLALAFARQAFRARDDLRLLVMSATLDPGPVARFLGDCPVVEGDLRPYPVETRYEPGLRPSDALREVLARPGGHVLCFLPGAPEIRRVQAELLGRVGDAVVRPLHGTLGAEEQDLALAPSRSRKVILATNVAETSLTVEGVTDVVDSGLQKVLRYDAERGLDRLVLERIGADSAEQRAGRAGRTGPGRALRLWDARDRLRARREPEIERVDLAGPALEVLAWGGQPASFEWFEAPPADRLQRALELLSRLGAVESGRLTALGEAMHRLPVHPRLACVLLSAAGHPRAAAACAMLAEGWRSAVGEAETTDSDVLSALDRWSEAPPSVKAVARELGELARVEPRERASPPDDATLRRALLAGFPDRVARRREPGSPRLVLASGVGAVLARESGVREAELLLALEVTAGAAGAGRATAEGAAAGEPLVRVASRVEREWLSGVVRETCHRFDEESGSVRAFARERYERIVLAENAVPSDPAEAGRLLAEVLESRGLGPSAERLGRRLRFAGLEADLHGVALAACRGRTSLPSFDAPEQWLDPATRAAVDRLAPQRLQLPSGRTAMLDYLEDGSLAAAVKLQELFGLGETPRLGPRRVPVTFALLAPNGRPVQTTRDLGSFWRTTYLQVRKELRGRYPRHPWPEDPWSAEPTHRAKKRASAATKRA